MGRERTKWSCFGTACLWEGDLVGWESKKFKCSNCCVLGRSERRASARATLIPATRLVSFAVQSTQSSPWRSPHTSPHRVARHCDDTCIECCATCMRAVRIKPVPISVQDTPAAIPHATWNNACGGSCTIRSGMRHEDELVCSPGLRFHRGGNVIAKHAQDPGHWRSAV